MGVNARLALVADLLLRLLCRLLADMIAIARGSFAETPPNILQLASTQPGAPEQQQ